jgi:hypothetical protein
MESEKVDKPQDPKVDATLMEEKKENKEEEDAVEGVSREPIEWVNKEKACAQLRVCMPEIREMGSGTAIYGT